jgi:hypothetical protein
MKKILVFFILFVVQCNFTLSISHFNIISSYSDSSSTSYLFESDFKSESVDVPINLSYNKKNSFSFFIIFLGFLIILFSWKFNYI